jgi:putative tryptophan/tyrosine transport system substrate-binding protein
MRSRSEPAELSAKRLEVLTDAFPSLSKIAMLWNADDLGMTLRYKSAEAAGRTLGLEIQPRGVRESDNFTAEFARWHATALTPF